jgi:hypothetical protein
MLDRRTASDDERQDAEGADDDEMDEDSEEDEDDGMSEDEDEEEGGDLDRLGNYISALQNGKRKAEDEDEGAGSRSKRRVLKDRGEDGRKEGEFGAPLNKSQSQGFLGRSRSRQVRSSKSLPEDVTEGFPCYLSFV